MNFADLSLGGGRLIQVANRTPGQMMSYLIDCPDGGVIVIDGGAENAADATALRELIRQHGNRVDQWYITHAHGDHNGALLYLLEHGKIDFEIGTVYFNFPTDEWLATREDWEYNKRFLPLIRNSGIPIVTPHAGDVYHLGGVRVEIIAEPIDYEEYPDINPTSIIFLVHFPARSVLFLGDFDVKGQENFFRHFDRSKLRCDIVQMAHHGQDAVDKSFYEIIAPKICLYTAPDWLWENNYYKCNDPATKGKGPFTTLETRKWMEELGVTASYRIADGDWIFT